MTTQKSCTMLQWALVLIVATTTCRALSSLQADPPAIGLAPSATGWQIGELHESPYFQALLQDLRQSGLEKRAPSNAFFGVRGKKAPSNANFFGVRGKKDDNEIMDEEWSDELEAMEKRAPASGFFGMRGKKRPSGFLGMRGKKGPSNNNFFGMRGKKSDEEVEASEELDTLLRALLMRNRPMWTSGDAEIVGPTLEDERRSLDGGQMQKKAPSGFVGMRGKKDNGWQIQPINAVPIRDSVERQQQLIGGTSSN